MPSKTPCILIPWFALGLVLGASAMAKPLVIPEISVAVTDSSDGRPVRGLEVDLLAKDKGDFQVLASAATDGDGRARFEAVAGREVKYVGVRFSWSAPDRPPRSLLYQFKAKKGGKTSGGRLARPGKSKAFYALASGLDGDCANLFSLAEGSSAVPLGGSQGGDTVELRFQRPVSYAECRSAHFKHADIGNIGQRNINAGALNLYSFEKDISMGRGFVDRMGPEQPILKDPLVTNYVVDLVDRLGKASDLPDLQYHVQVIDAAVMNAFALPGGYVFVYRGLIEATENESELVGVLAHELAHVTGRHGTEGVTTAMGKMALAMGLGGLAANEITDNRTAQELIQGAVMSGTNFWVVGGTRKREAEADRVGAQYALRAGYDPRGLATFFDKLAAQRTHKASRLDQLFSDHPSDEVRVRSVHEMVDYFLPERGDLIVSSAEYKAVKKRLAQLPAPKMAGETAANALFSSFKAANEAMIWTEFLEYVKPPEEEYEGE